MNRFFSIALIALVVASCQNSNHTETTEVETDSATTVAAAVAPLVDSGNQNVISTTPVTVPAPTAATVNPNAGATGLNPQHGQPGHRCDIAVGAPLNSPPGNAAAPAISSSPAPTISQAPAAAAPASGKTRLNPAHGEPGHDCSVAVGQPLKG
jgi:hypothetical protein